MSLLAKQLTSSAYYSAIWVCFAAVQGSAYCKESDRFELVLLPFAGLEQLVTGPIQHMAPETLQAGLQRALPKGQKAFLSAAVIFSLGVLLNRLLGT